MECNGYMVKIRLVLCSNSTAFWKCIKGKSVLLEDGEFSYIDWPLEFLQNLGASVHKTTDGVGSIRFCVMILQKQSRN
jgi:hypothetical protein